jgi:hypothetical protein
VIETENFALPRNPSEISIRQLLDALQDDARTLNPRFLYRLSDLEGAELLHLEEAWGQTPLWRRRALMEDLHLLAEADNLLSFEGVGRLAIMDSDAQVRFGGVQTLVSSECDSLDLIATYLDLAEVDEDGNVRAIATAALAPFVLMGEMDHLPKTVQADLEQRLLKLAESDRDVVVRRKALESLGYSGRSDVGALIRTAFEARDPEWIASATFAMGRSADDRWQEQVLAMLDHDHASIRIEAARAAGELGLSAAKARLVDLTEDAEIEIQLVALWSLSQIGGKGVQELFVRRIKHAHDDQELKFLEQALDNLAFNSGDDAFQMFYIPEMDDEDHESSYLQTNHLNIYDDDDDEDEYVDIEELYFAEDEIADLEDDLIDHRYIESNAFVEDDDED